MKLTLSLALSALILLLAALLARRYDARLALAANEPHRSSYTPASSTARHDSRNDPAQAAAALFADLLANLDDPDLAERLLTLSSAESEALLHLLLDAFSDGSLPGAVEDPDSLLYLPLSILAYHRPARALELLPRFLESTSEPNRRMLGTGILTEALVAWGSQDPSSALAWFQRHHTDFDSLIPEKTRLSFLAAIAFKDPALAFQVIDRIGIGNIAVAISSIVRTAADPRKRTQTLHLLRSHTAALPGQPEILDAAIETLAKDAFNDGFSSASRWAAENLQGEELTRFSTAIRSRIPSSGEAPDWILWQHQHLPSETASANIRQIVADWTLADFHSAGQWLLSAPPGAARDIASQAYLETVTPYLSTQPSLAPILSQLQNP